VLWVLSPRLYLCCFYSFPIWPVFDGIFLKYWASSCNSLAHLSLVIDTLVQYCSLGTPEFTASLYCYHLGPFECSPRPPVLFGFSLVNSSFSRFPFLTSPRIAEQTPARRVSGKWLPKLSYRAGQVWHFQLPKSHKFFHSQFVCVFESLSVIHLSNLICAVGEKSKSLYLILQLIIWCCLSHSNQQHCKVQAPNDHIQTLPHCLQKKHHSEKVAASTSKA